MATVEIAERPLAAPPKPATALTQQLLHGPIVPTLLRLAAPNIVVIAVQAVVNAAEAMFVGWLGAEALAGVALVFPLIMLMQTMSAGGMGGGVASAVARAVGAGRRPDAEALAWHAGVIGLVMGAVFTVGFLWGGPALYAAMGGTGNVLTVAVAYSHIVFSGAIAFWLFNLLAAVVRGTGNMRLPALVVLGGAVITLTVSPALILGWGPFPRLGVAGAAWAMVAYYALGTLVLLAHLTSGRGLVRLSLDRLRLRTRLFWDILRVGAPGALNTIQTNLTVVMLTGLVGPFGSLALAGYGVGARLEYLQIPLVFGLGSALVTMVGTNIGAGQHARARRIMWSGAAVATVLTGSIGLIAALAPDLWLGLFSQDPDVLAAGRTYLHIVGPAYGFFGLGLSLYFASQGLGRLGWPLIAGFARLTVATVGGWIVVHRLGGELPALFAIITLALVVFGTTVAVALWRRSP
jgi:putative MATE family efflux protein